MTTPQLLICLLLVLVFAGFAWGRYRHDVVAFAALVAAVPLGLVPFEQAFAGFGHPATVTVALVLIISRALSNAGATDVLVRPIMAATGGPTRHVGALSGLAAAMSAVMNNVGALAILMPVAMQSAAKAARPPSLLLMPLAFGSILGGMMTLIGTPPNIIVATFRGDALGAPFGMFDFTPVGGACAVIGVAFVALLGWRLLPDPKRRAGTVEEFFAIEGYVAEARVVEGAKAVGRTLHEAAALTDDVDAQIVGLVRGERRLPAAPLRARLEVDDVLLVEASAEELGRFAATLGLELIGSEGDSVEKLRSHEVEVIEAVVPPASALDGRRVGLLSLGHRYGVNLLAASRQGRPYRGRLRRFTLRAGDVLLLQGTPDRLAALTANTGLLPLATRDLRLQRGRAGVAGGLFAAAVLAATFNLLPLQIAFGAAVVAMVVSGLIAPREIYGGVDWPVVVLLGAMIPIGGALQATGTTELIAGRIADTAAAAPPAAVVALLLVVTMTLSDVLNNAATVVVMAPIALAVAAQLGVNPDAFLMAVAVGASCAFLTPIGHQNNTLVMGPGGYAFGDYWRMGLPLELVIVAVATPLLLLVWPL